MLRVLPKGRTVLTSFLVMSPALMVAPDAAAVGNGRVYGLAVLLGAPDQRVGDEVAQICLTVPVAVGGLGTVELIEGLGKYGAVIVIDLLLDGGGAVATVLSMPVRVLGGGGALRHLAVGVNDDHADTLELRAGEVRGVPLPRPCRPVAAFTSSRVEWE